MTIKCEAWLSDSPLSYRIYVGELFLKSSTSEEIEILSLDHFQDDLRVHVCDIKKQCTKTVPLQANITTTVSTSPDVHLNKARAVNSTEKVIEIINTYPLKKARAPIRRYKES